MGIESSIVSWESRLMTDDRRAAAAVAIVHGSPGVPRLTRVDRFLWNWMGTVSSTLLDQHGHMATLAQPEDALVFIDAGEAYPIARRGPNSGIADRHLGSKNA
jgi:hypothetical protein